MAFLRSIAIPVLLDTTCATLSTCQAAKSVGISIVLQTEPSVNPTAIVFLRLTPPMGVLKRGAIRTNATSPYS